MANLAPSDPSEFFTYVNSTVTIDDYNESAFPIHLKATAIQANAHSSVAFTYLSVVPGQRYSLQWPVNIVTKPAEGQAAYFVWIDADGNGLYEIRGNKASATGEQKLELSDIAPHNAARVTCVIGNGGVVYDIPSGRWYNLQQPPEVSEFYTGRPILQTGVRAPSTTAMGSAGISRG